MHPVERNNAKKVKIDEKPFADLKVSDFSILDKVEERCLCTKCGKSRKYFCYICYLPVKQLQGLIPQLSLPIKIDIIKHRNEIDGKSTSAHAKLIAPNDVRISTFPCIPEFDPEENVVLIYPAKDAKTVKEIFEENNKNSGDNKLPITRAVFIDSTWNQSKGIYKDERIKCLPSVILKNKISQFWRHQKGSPRWYLATIEAIHELLIEIDGEMNKRQGSVAECSATEKSPECAVADNVKYDGKYDDLLFFFCFMYTKIHNLYDHDTLLSYKRPLE